MQNLLRITLVVLTISAASASRAESVVSCPPSRGVALQVLGSGGPVADDGRASSGYIVWVNGKSRVLIDAGGGTFLRFGEAGADFGDLDFIGLSHFHTDHSADFPALLKSGYFSARERPLRVAGPDAGGPFPGLGAYLHSMLDASSGAYGYLSGYLDGSGGLVKIEAIEVSSELTDPFRVFGDESSDVRIDALHVPHGIVPALAFRVRVGDVSIVFSSDQNGTDPDFVSFVKGATILVMHMPIPENATGGVRQLHAPPGVLGEIAENGNVKTLLLSHFMARSLSNLEENVEVVRSEYEGTIIIASDLACMTL